MHNPKFKISFSVIDTNPLETFEENKKAIKEIIINEFSNYDYDVADDIQIEEIK